MNNFLWHNRYWCEEQPLNKTQLKLHIGMWYKGVTQRYSVQPFCPDNKNYGHNKNP